MPETIRQGIIAAMVEAPAVVDGKRRDLPPGRFHRCPARV